MAKHKELTAVKNLVGAEEVDSIIIPEKTAWQKFLFFFRTQKLRRFLWAIFRTVIFAGLAYIILNPIIIQFATSIKTELDLYDSTIIFIPRNPTLEAYVAMWNYIKVPQLYFNSILWAGILGLLQMCSCMFVAYGLARFQFKGRGLIFGLVVITLVVPI